jgi:hypothetical protein
LSALTVIISGSVALTVGAVVIWILAVGRGQQQLVAYALHFPKNLESDDVMNALAGFSGLLLPWWKRWGVLPHVVLEVQADLSGIRHQILVAETWAPVVENILQASVPSVRFERTEIQTSPVTIAVEYRLSARGRTLEVDAEALSAKLLFGLQPLKPDQHVVVSWILTPAAPVPPVRVADVNDLRRFWRPAGTMPNNEMAAALKQKQSKPLMLGVARIGVASKTIASSRRLLRTVEAAWHESRAPGVHLVRRWIPEPVVAKWITRRTAPLLIWPSTSNTHELSGLIGWPIGATSIPGLALDGSRLLAASPIIPMAGTVVADSNFPGHMRTLALDLEGRLRHVHVLGPTGTGKSTLLVQMVIQDLIAGRGVVLIDPKGDLVQEVLRRIPEGRRSDVVVLDPASPGGRVVGLNPLQVIDPDQRELVVENLVGLFRSLYRANWGPRTDDTLRAAIGALAHAGASLSARCR